ncbi:MAG TPA: polynucleotide adenylyltransferase PcnB [Chlamydiales bacterium]|nr:polynucleotide adenylyltransferase PcnB [Chlamydiales bacterium]
MQPKIYSLEDHSLSADKIDQHAFYVIHKLREAGYEAYLVGGSVRDLLLGTKPKDYDIATSAKPEEIKAVFRNAILIGKRFRLAHVRFGKKVIEVSTFRSGDIENSVLIVRDNDWGTAEEDVLRRDFTINGLCYDPETQTVLDYVGGYPDLQKKILRTIGQPETRFRQDPVRMIRLLKFHARFGFSIDPASTDALMKCKEDIIKSSHARILEELLRMLESGASQPFFQFLFEYGLLDLLMPHLSSFLTRHPKEIYSYLQLVDQEIKKKEETFDRPLLLSCLLYPMLVHNVSKKVEDPKTFHLGLVSQEATDCIDAVFRPFFHLPRRMRGGMVSLLTSQFRFTPLQERLKKRMRPPKDPFFHLALRFLKLRADLEPSLLETYSLWQQAAGKEIRPHHPPRRRRRRRHVQKDPI